MREKEAILYVLLCGKAKYLGRGARLKDKIESKKLIWKILININNKVNKQLYANVIVIHNLT